jgi:hypothetical protein
LFHGARPTPEVRDVSPRWGLSGFSGQRPGFFEGGTINEMTKLICVSLADLHYLTLECAKCHTAVTLNLAELRIADEAKCPLCDAEREPEARGVTALHGVYQDLRHSSAKISFLIAVDELHS